MGAQFAGQTVAGSAITDVREAVRGRFARLLGRGDARKMWMFRIVLGVSGGNRYVLQVAHLTDRGERLTRGEGPGADRVPDRVRHLLPGGLTAGGIDSENRYVPVLGERLAMKLPEVCLPWWAARGSNPEPMG